ncbi:potassium two pore domain channel sandman isoform X1 [Lycorma delicatula]|uniref:potassium two pore domain channel sandman isoform X1 n=1 Tax=Lycorma delicatula TaxID=130591 RepID=UPI003F5145D2
MKGMLGSDGRKYQFQVPHSGGYRNSGTTGTGTNSNTTSTSTHNSILCCSSSQRSSSPCCSVVSSLLSSAGICILVVTYTVLGAVTFMTLEGQNPGELSISITRHSWPSSTDDRLRSQTVEKLWSITEDLNILYKENWTRLAEQEVLKFQDILVRKYRSMPSENENHIWSFPSSFLYSLTLITTIGYGSVSPRTTWGRITTVLYALIGIPLMLVYLSTVGDSLAKYIRKIYTRLNRNNSHPKTKKDPGFVKTTLQNHITAEKKPVNDEKIHEMKLCSTGESHPVYDTEPQNQRIPILLTLSIVVIYISGGALLFKRLENWTFLEGSYFCFTSLGTIGFGELIPGTTDTNEEVSVFVSSAYILIGMAVIAMCFNLVQDETVLLVRQVSLWINKDENVLEEDQEVISMSVVSS